MATARQSGGRANRKDEILAATEKLLRTKGLSGTTTRQIAEAVGCSEGAIYVHFRSRADLLLAVLDRSLPEMLKPLHALRESVGQGTPEGNLQSAMMGILAFQRRVTPMLCSLFAEPDLHEAYRKSLLKEGKGPHRATANLATYIRAEQNDGRIPSRLDADTAASLLMSACFFRAFSDRFFGRGGDADKELAQVIKTVLY